MTSNAIRTTPIRLMWHLNGWTFFAGTTFEIGKLNLQQVGLCPWWKMQEALPKTISLQYKIITRRGERKHFMNTLERTLHTKICTVDPAQTGYLWTRLLTTVLFVAVLSGVACMKDMDGENRRPNFIHNVETTRTRNVKAGSAFWSILWHERLTFSVWSKIKSVSRTKHVMHDLDHVLQESRAKQRHRQTRL